MVIGTIVYFYMYLKAGNNDMTYIVAFQFSQSVFEYHTSDIFTQ